MQAAVKALTNVHGTSYKYGPAAITICKYEVFIIWRGNLEVNPSVLIGSFLVGICPHCLVLHPIGCIRGSRVSLTNHRAKLSIFCAYYFRYSVEKLLTGFISFPDPTTGDTTDWTFGVLGVVHSYCVELRPKTYGQGGFILPPDKIIPVGQETFAGLKALTRNM